MSLRADPLADPHVEAELLAGDALDAADELAAKVRSLASIPIAVAQALDAYERASERLSDAEERVVAARRADTARLLAALAEAR